MTRLAHLLHQGDGVSLDLKESFAWFLKAARMGDAEAANSVGVCYLQGLGTPSNPRLARRWFVKAAEEGADQASGNAGQCYHLGLGGRKDLDKALEWYERGVEAGQPDAMNGLGVLMKEGQGIPQDLPGGVDLFRRSAEPGHANGQYQGDRIRPSRRGRESRGVFRVGAGSAEELGRSRPPVSRGSGARLAVRAVQLCPVPGEWNGDAGESGAGPSLVRQGRGPRECHGGRGRFTSRGYNGKQVLRGSFAPSGADVRFGRKPTADAVGYCLSVLRT